MRIKDGLLNMECINSYGTYFSCRNNLSTASHNVNLDGTDSKSRYPMAGEYSIHPT